MEAASVTYRPTGRWGRVLLLLGFAVFVAAAVWLVLRTVRGEAGPPVVFLALWLGILVWNAYWWLFRVCVEVRVDGTTLEWAAPLRRDRAPLGDVVRIRPSRAGRQLAVVELQGRRPVMVPVRVGFGRLERAIEAGAPKVVIDET
jgi:hypothetical protein